MRVIPSQRLIYTQMLRDYLNKYREKYSPGAIEYIINNFLNHEDLKGEADILMQIYDLLGLLDKSENYYLGFAETVAKKYGLDCRFLEVGGGYFPAFSYHLDQLQQEANSSGTITVYDPKLVVTGLGNVHLRHSMFTSETSIDEFDVLVGIMPCDATKIMIKKATEAHKEFYIAMCGCIPDNELSKYSYMMMYTSPIPFWIDDVYGLAKEQTKDGFEVTYEDNPYGAPYPVISSRKR